MPVPLLDLKAQHATIRDEVVRTMMQVVDDQLPARIAGGNRQQLVDDERHGAEPDQIIFAGSILSSAGTTSRASSSRC